MYETSPVAIEMSDVASVCPRQAWQSFGNRLELERELIFLPPPDPPPPVFTPLPFPRHLSSVFIDVLGVSHLVLLIHFPQTFTQEN